MHQSGKGFIDKSGSGCVEELGKTETVGKGYTESSEFLPVLALLGVHFYSLS